MFSWLSGEPGDLVAIRQQSVRLSTVESSQQDAHLGPMWANDAVTSSSTTTLALARPGHDRFVGGSAGSSWDGLACPVGLGWGFQLLSIQLPDERVELSRSGQPDLDFRMVGEPQQPAAWVGLGEPRRLLPELLDAEVRAELGPGLRDVADLSEHWQPIGERADR